MHDDMQVFLRNRRWKNIGQFLRGFQLDSEMRKVAIKWDTLHKGIYAGLCCQGRRM